jgi:hypothetical protein
MARLNARTVGGRKMFGQVDETGQHTIFQPHIGRNSIAVWDVNFANSVSGTMFTQGLALNIVGGTAAFASPASTNAWTRLQAITIPSASTAGSIVYMRNSGSTDAGLVSLGGTGISGIGGFHYIARFAVRDASTVSGARMCVGLEGANLNAAPTNVDPAGLLNHIGVAQLSTDATQMYIVYGGSTAQTSIALGTNFPPTLGAVYELILHAPENSNNTVYYQVNRLDTSVTPASGTLTGTAGVALPANTTFLTPRLWRTNNATALSVTLGFISMYLETDT